MKNFFLKRNQLVQVLLIMLVVFLSFQKVVAINKEIVILVHQDNPLTDISSTNLRRIWLGKMNEVEGVLVSPMGSELQIDCKILFYKSILNKSRKGLRHYYLREELKGVFHKPKSLKTIKHLLLEITSDTTAIGFIDKYDLPDSAGVKILTVDGKNSSDKDYKIK